MTLKNWGSRVIRKSFVLVSPDPPLLLEPPVSIMRVKLFTQLTSYGGSCPQFFCPLLEGTCFMPLTPNSLDFTITLCQPVLLGCGRGFEET